MVVFFWLVLYYKFSKVHQFRDANINSPRFPSLEKAKEVRQVAKNGKTTLKRAMEIMEVALPPFLTACEKSYEKNDLTLEVGIEYEQYETCMSEKRRAGLDFDLGERKTVEASNHLSMFLFGGIRFFQHES